MSKKTKAAVYGISGRMGRRIATLLLENSSNLSLAGAIDSPGSPLIGEDVGKVLGREKTGIIINDDINKIAKKIDVIIDFSTPEASTELSRLATKLMIPAVVGTTGLSTSQMKELEKASKKIPLLISPNMSFGINLLSKLVEQTAKTLPEDFQIEVVEAHHKFKQDAPSGTAIMLAKAAAAGRKLIFDSVKCFSRSGNAKRKANEIGIQAIRGGDIVGEHTIYFIGTGERLELTHRATSKDTFASGAIKAAEWLIGKPAGIYDMLDVLNLKGKTQ